MEVPSLIQLDYLQRDNPKLFLMLIDIHQQFPNESEHQEGPDVIISRSLGVLRLLRETSRVKQDLCWRLNS